MVLLRGLFGARLSYLPTAMNVVQCFGWGIFELVTIATAAHTIAPRLPRPGYVLIAGVITGLLTIRPLGAIRTLRRYATVAVMIVGLYILIQLLRQPLPGLTAGTWSGFWAATDTVVGVGVSFVPLAADYTRHSRSPREAAAGVLIGYSATQILCYALGLLALLTVARHSGDIFGAFIALPLGSLAFAVLAARELDQSFADVYSTAMSIQNLKPLWDRRLLAAVITALATAGALWLNIADYENFLTLIGSVRPAERGARGGLLHRRERQLGPLAASGHPLRSLIPWATGFVVYQLINPGYVTWWATIWRRIDASIGFTPASWMSASILSFVAAGLLTLLSRSLTRSTPSTGAAPEGLQDGRVRQSGFCSSTGSRARWRTRSRRRRSGPLSGPSASRRA